MRGKTRQTVENKHTFDLTEKNEIDEKNRQNTENKQTLIFDGIFNCQFQEIFTDTYLFLWFLCFYINVCR